MKDKNETKEQLIEEIAEMRQRIAELENEDTRRSKPEERESKLFKELKTIYDNLPVGIVYLDNKFRIVRSNRNFNDFAGFQEEELKGKLCYEIVGEYADDPAKNGLEKICSFCKKDECFKHKRPTVMERPLGDKYIRVITIPQLNKEGEICCFMEIVEDITKRKQAEEALEKAKEELETRIKVRTADLEKTNVLLSREITERRKAEDQIRQSLKEKEVLLQEIHHRVKNNMEVISSLLRLQAGHIKDEQYRELIRISTRRIKTMASIHEKIYRSDNMAEIDFSAYLNDMAVDIFNAYELMPGQVILKRDIEDVSLSINDAIPCGLIVNELVSNSLKYAFPKGREGEVRVALRINDKDAVELTVGDNGVGMPEGLDFRNADTLGMNLITTLARQLEGEIELRREKGAEFQITFRRRE